MKFEFFVPGVPVAQPRARARAFQNQAGETVATVYNPRRGKDAGWKESVWVAAKMAGLTPMSGPVSCSLTFILPRPKYMQAKKFDDGRIPHGQRPDRDNLDKAVLDALKGIALQDDGQVYAGSITKLYQAKADDQVGVYVELASPQ